LLARKFSRSSKAGAWLFAPGIVRLREGQAVQARNIGGEAHTFTEVDDFGGGIVPVLNDLSGNPVPAPECVQLGPADFIPPGGVSAPDVEEPGVHHYQCCIHPWMRADVVVR
jgi:plastocyanin